MNHSSQLAPRYEALFHVSDCLSVQRDVAGLLRVLPFHLHPVLDFNYMSVFLNRDLANEASWYVPDGEDRSALTAARDVPIEQAHVSWTFEHQQFAVVRKLDPEARFSGSRRLLSERGLESGLALPITTAHRRIGAMFLGSEYPCPCSDEEARLMLLVADRVARAVDDVRRHELCGGQSPTGSLGEGNLPLSEKAAWASVFGEILTLEELRSGDAVASLIDPGDLERMRAARDRGIAAGEPFEHDSRLRGRDGIYRWFLARYNPLVEENVRLEERTRIARELHDTLLQTFQSASLHLGVAVLRVAQDSPVKNQLDRILEIMRQGIVEGRNAIQGLRSPGSQTSDLVGALSRIQDELKVQPDFDFRVTVTGRQKQLAPEIQHEIYRIGREALVNAFCHSGAKRIELALEYSDSELYVRIRDNGRGIDPQVLEKGRDGHWGLAGMQERSTRIGALLKILSSPAAGTEVQLSIPTTL